MMVLCPASQPLPSPARCAVALLLPVVPLFTGVIAWLTLPTPSLIWRPTLSLLDHSLKFNNVTNNEITTAHCSVPLLEHSSDKAGPELALS